MSACVNACLSVCLSVCMYVCMYVSMYVCISIFEYVCLYECTCFDTAFAVRLEKMKYVFGVAFGKFLFCLPLRDLTLHDQSRCSV